MPAILSFSRAHLSGPPTRIPRADGSVRAKPLTLPGWWLTTLTLLVVAFGACGDGSKRPAARQNILILLADDQSRSDLGIYGNDAVHTPRIDALAAEGMLFSHAFTPATVCIPSRGVMMTGRYPQSSGIVGFGERGRPNEDAVTLIELLKELGYRSGVIGKSALFPLRRYPFDFRRYSVARSPATYRNSVREFLERNDDRPFFLLVSLRDPHRPFPTTKGTRKIADPEDVRIPPFLPDTPAIRMDLARYYGAIRRLDESVGAILDELEAQGLASSTLTIYTSDHGQSIPYAKGTLYDAGMRVPFIARWPGVVPAGSRSDAMFSFVDVLPTLLDAVKADDVIPTNIQGHSLMAVMRGEVHRHREIVFGDLDYLGGHYPSRAVRSRQYKYIYNEPVDEDYGQESIANASWWSMLKLARGNDEIAARVEKLLRRPREELYDLERDPGELHNLLAGEDHEAQRAELAHQLRCWMEETGDSLSLPADVAAPTPCRPAARGGLGLR